MHPYTQALLRSIPPTGAAAFRTRGTKGRSLPTIEGTLPDLRSPPPGCRFQARCPAVMDRCKTEAVPLFDRPGGVSVRCFLVEAEQGVA
jgi:oligopeptide/dipeptide ABC transporter ATP-binding protein